MTFQNVAVFSSETSKIAILLLSLLTLASLFKQKTLVVAIPASHLRVQYPPISDAWLRTLLGYSDEEYLPKELLINKQQPIFIDNGEISHWKSNHEVSGAPMQLQVSKRKNAELVNHILKNFASINFNRLGDAGK